MSLPPHDRSFWIISAWSRSEWHCHKKRSSVSRSWFTAEAINPLRRHAATMPRVDVSDHHSICGLQPQISKEPARNELCESLISKKANL